MTRVETKFRTEVGDEEVTFTLVELGMDDFAESFNRAAANYEGEPPGHCNLVSWVARSSNTIYMLEGAYSPKLLAHQLGHLLEHDHDRWLPTMMNKKAAVWDRRGLLEAIENREQVS